MKRSTIISGLAVVCFSTAASAVKVPLPPELKDQSLTINVQMQTWAQAAEKSGPPQDANPIPTAGWDPRIFIRRARLILSGDFTKQLHFFINIDSPNFGRNGGFADPVGTSGRFLLQDLRMVYEPVPGVFISGGLLILPLSHHIHQSTLSYKTIEIHAATLRFQQASTGNSNLAFREPGIEAHGWLFDKILGFRAGVYNGVRGASAASGGPDPLQPLNPDGIPRVAGRLQLNLLESEERGFLYQGIYFTDKPILGIGAGISFQPKSVRSVNPNTGAPAFGRADYRGAAADIFFEYPFPGDMSFNAEFDGYNYDFGPGHPSTGNGFFGDLGFRYGQWQLVGSYEYFDGNSNPAVPDDARIWTAGLNWWINRTTTNLKAEFQWLRRGDMRAPQGSVRAGFQNQKIVTIAGQLFF